MALIALSPKPVASVLLTQSRANVWTADSDPHPLAVMVAERWSVYKRKVRYLRVEMTRAPRSVSPAAPPRRDAGGGDAGQRDHGERDRGDRREREQHLLRAERERRREAGRPFQEAAGQRVAADADAAPTAAPTAIVIALSSSTARHSCPVS